MMEEKFRREELLAVSLAFSLNYFESINYETEVVFK